MFRMQNLIKQFTSKQHGPLVQFIKYGIGGGAATAVHVVIFYAMAGFVFRVLTEDDLAVRYLHLPIADIDDSVRARLTAKDNFVAFMFSNLVAYIINVKWVFEGGKHKRSVEFLMFFAVSATSIAVGTTVAWGLIQWFGLTTTVAFISNIVASVMINYVMRKFVIFKG